MFSKLIAEAFGKGRKLDDVGQALDSLESRVGLAEQNIARLTNELNDAKAAAAKPAEQATG